MKVPVLEPSVAARGPAGYSPQQVRPDFGAINDVRGVVGEAAQAWDTGAGKLDAEAKAARQQGSALALAESSLQLEDRLAGSLLKFKQARGTQASEARASTYEEMDKQRQEVAAGIADADARKQYLVRSAETLAGYHRQVDSHALRQFDVARDETLDARVKQAVGLAEAGDFDTWLPTARAVEEDIAKLHPDAAPEVVAAFRSDVAMAQVRGMLARGEAKRADEALSDVTFRKELSGHFDEASALVARARKVEEKSAAKSEAEQLAVEVLKAARQPDGYLDGPKAQADIANVPEASRIYARTLINEQVAADARRKEADIKGWRNEARSILNRTGRFSEVPVELVDKLERYDAEYANRLRDDSAREARRAQVRAGKGGAARVAKEQSQADRLAELRFLNLSRAEQATTDPEDFVTGMGVSEQGRLKIGIHARVAHDMAEKGMASDSDAFTRLAASEARRVGISGGKRPMPAEKQAEFNAAAQAAFTAWTAEHGRAPTMAESKTLLEPLLVDVKVRKEWWFGLTREATVKGFEAQPAARPVASSPAAAPARPDADALRKWAEAHPGDPRSARILQKLGAR